MIICCEGFSILCERHAREAQAQMSGAGPKRRADLERVARVCAHLARNPPAPLQPALEMGDFVVVGQVLEGNAGG